MSGSIGQFGNGNIPADNGLGVSANGTYQLGGNLIRATQLNATPTETLAITGLTAGDPSTDSLMVVDPTGVVKFINVQGLPDFWRGNIGDTLPDGTTDHTDQISHAGNVGLGITDASTVRARLDVSGAVIHRAVALTNFAANAAIGTAAATVDIASVITINQTTAGIALTLPSPTQTQSGRLLIVGNIGTQSVTVGGQVINVSSGLPFVWTGAAWIALGTAPADFWRTITNAQPDNVTDTADSIRRLGHVGIGGAAITDAMPTVTTPSATNNYLQLSSNAANRGQLMYGNSPVLYYMTRTVPVTLNDYVSVGSWTVTAQANVFSLAVNVSDGSFAASKYYVGAFNWDATGGGWRVLKPLSNGGAFGANDYDLLINVGGGVVSLRLRRKSGATAGTFRLYLQLYNDPAVVFTESAATANDPAAYTTFDPFGSADFWRSAAGATLPDGTNDTSEFVSRTGSVGIGSNTQVGTSQLSVVSDSNVITDPIASFQALNLTQGVDIIWAGIQKSGTSANSDLSINAKGTGNIVVHAAAYGEVPSTGNLGVGVSPAAKLDVNGAEILRPVTIADLPTGGSIGTAAATVDIASIITLNQATSNQSITIPNPTNTTAGRLLIVVLNGAATGTKINSFPIATDRNILFVWDGNSWDPHSKAALNEWLLTGNASTSPSAYNDAGAQSNNFLGTTDNQNVSIYTNASNANAKTDLLLYTATPTTATVTAPVDVFQIRRNGQSGVTYPQSLAVALGHWWTDGSARTRADFKLGNGNVYRPDTTMLTLFSQGGVGINGNGGAADWAWGPVSGGIGRGNGGALLALMGANGSNNVGPHIGAWTTSDTYPIYYQLNWQHDNVAMLFDAYFDGNWRYAHTSRPYAIYKNGGNLNFYGSTAAGVAGNAWTQDLMARFRYAGETLAGGELDFNNVVKNRRIVLWDANAASDHQFYGFGINASTLRYQTDSTASNHVWYAATAAGTSNELMRLTGTGRLGIGVNGANPSAILQVNGSNANAGAGAPLFRLSDTNIAGSYFAVDNGAAANGYRTIATTNMELQSGANSNQLFLSTNAGVGIGTAAPTAGLGILSCATNGLKPGGGAWGVFSDKRVKQNIQPVTWGLNEILALRPVSFQYNGKAANTNDGRTHYGLIAQELQEVIPDFVEPLPINESVYEAMSEEEKAEFPDKTLLSIKEGMTNLEAVLVTAIQELTARVKELEAKLATV